MDVENIHNHNTSTNNSAAAAAAASCLASRMVTSNKPASGVPKKRGQPQGGGGDLDGNNGKKEPNKLVGWHNASRIIRVSRVSGGKDRHSKVWTSRGLRDRRIRLSVTTAIRFYDLQDRLGYDQPSKAVEWLIKAAADPIAELPSLNNPFPAKPNDDEADLDCEEGGFHHHRHHHQQQQQQQKHLSLSKSSACTCSSTSDTSKGSGLSLSRTDVRENRAKARERAKERASSKDVRQYVREDDDDDIHHHQHHHHNTNINVSPNSNDNNDTSYTELLASTAAAASAVHHFDYFNSGLLPQPRPNNPSGFFGQMQLGNPFPFHVGGENQPELQHFPVVPDHLIPASSTQSQSGGGGGGGDHSLNFTVSSGGGGASAGFNRGTLQSNLPSMWPPHMFQRLSPPDGPNNLPFFLGGTTATVTATAVENHTQTHQHPFPSGFDSRLLFCYGDASARRNSDQKGNGKH